MRRILFALAVLLCLAPQAWAWGPHPDITRAALAVLPEQDHWKQVLGADNLAAFQEYCWMPDMRGQDLGRYYADDYLLIRALPRHIEHVMPGVEEGWEIYFRRALQALRTETPANACRQIGPLLHFVEDSGAPPHAKPRCPHHGELENWVRADQIAIPGYQPQLLGKTDDEALAGFRKRMAGLVAFSAERADRALPFVTQAQPDRAKVEPILLESALESARAAADVLYTVFTLGTAPQPVGAGLSGTVTAAAMPGGNDHGARIILLDSDYCTLATPAPGPAPAEGWKGAYEFHHLPAGTYRVLAYRTASQFRVSDPVTLKVGQTAKVDFTLPAAEPAGNLVQNPDARLCALVKDVPDRWRCDKRGGKWICTGALVKLAPGTTYRFGAALKDPAAKVRFQFMDTPGKTGEVALPAGTPEVRQKAEGKHPAVIAIVEGDKPLAEMIERVWVVGE